MKKKKKVTFEMELVGGGLEPDELKRIFGARCICSSGQANAYKGGGCQCDYGPLNGWANFDIAHPEI